MESEPFGEDPNGTREAIMRATYRALCEHGYAALTIADIGTEFDKSVSLVYHHYEGKDDLLVDFLGYMLERFRTEVAIENSEDPREQLRAALVGVRTGPLAADRREFTSALTELRAQAAHDPAFRDQIEKTDAFFHERIADIVRAGIEQGVFRDVDPDRVATMMVTTVNGAMLTHVTTDTPVTPALDELDAYIESRLIVEEGEGGGGGEDGS
jgi:AcrR family transcriptional regulator